MRKNGNHKKPIDPAQPLLERRSQVNPADSQIKRIFMNLASTLDARKDLKVRKLGKWTRNRFFQFVSDCFVTRSFPHTVSFSPLQGITSNVRWMFLDRRRWQCHSPGNKLNSFQSEDIKALSEPLTMTTINIYTQVIDGPELCWKTKSERSRRLPVLYIMSVKICAIAEVLRRRGSTKRSGGVLLRFPAHTWEVSLPLQLAGHREDLPGHLLGWCQGGKSGRSPAVLFVWEVKIALKYPEIYQKGRPMQMPQARSLRIRRPLLPLIQNVWSLRKVNFSTNPPRQKKMPPKCPFTSLFTRQKRLRFETLLFLVVSFDERYMSRRSRLWGCGTTNVAVSSWIASLITRSRAELLRWDSAGWEQNACGGVCLLGLGILTVA